MDIENEIMAICDKQAAIRSIMSSTAEKMLNDLKCGALSDMGKYLNELCTLNAAYIKNDETRQGLIIERENQTKYYSLIYNRPKEEATK